MTNFIRFLEELFDGLIITILLILFTPLGWSIMALSWIIYLYCL